MTTNQPTPRNHSFDEILAVLKSGKTFSLSGHQSPDADVIGSELALASLIRRIGSPEKIDLQNKGKVPDYLSFLPGIDVVKDVEKVEGKYDVVIVFECSGADRMGNIIDLKTQAKTVINLDHHLHNPYFGDINFVEPKTSSLSEIIFKLFDHAKLSLSADEAICLFGGMVTDTGWFRYSNTNAQTLGIAKKLLEAGLEVAPIAERVYMARTLPSVKLFAEVLSKIELHYDNRVALLKVPVSVMEKVQATSDDIEDLVNQGLVIKGVCASILIKEKKDPLEVKVSLRSKGTYDINQVARVFNGGGHKNASGCAIPGSLEKAEAALLKEIKRIF